MLSTQKLLKFTQSIKEYKKKFLDKPLGELDESGTRLLINHFLTEMLGYETLSEVKTEYMIKGTYADYVIQVGGKRHFLVEVKALSLNLSSNHLRQSINYGANEGIDFVLLTNGKVFELYRVIFEKPISHELIFSLNLSDLSNIKGIAEQLQYLHKDAIIKKLLDFTQTAVTQLDGTHFDIDDRMKFCDARLAPEGSASAPYYMSPSEDMSRPGTTWLPLLGKDEVSWWHLASTWYHEAVPGHHLQVATSVLERDRLSRFQRFGAWISGYGEGWALYAERFMDDLGAFDEPGIEMGFLSAQALRATRIVIDIGMHLGYTDENGRVWDAVSGREALMNKALLDEHHATSETDRYLGWPGQAISYKVGEREWIAARENAKKRLGAEFSLKRFHAHALKIGPMGLDTFGQELALWDGK